jgi:capsular exopolysaccharide synthesis family protein
MGDLIRREPSHVPAAYQARPANIWIDDYLDEQQGEITRYVQIIFKRKWIVLAVAVVMLGAAAFNTSRKDRVYTSSVNIQIDPEQSVLPYQEMYATVTADPKYLTTQAQVLKSEVLARRIVARLGLATEEPAVTNTARWFKGNVTVAAVEGTQILKVTYRGQDPEFVAKAVNTMADAYVDYGYDVKRVGTTKAREFLEAELLKLKKKLESSEQKLVNYGRAHGILVSTQGGNVITTRLTDLEQEMTRVETQLLSNQYDSLRGTTIANFPDKLKTNVMQSLESRRSELEQKAATLQLQFGAKWPALLTVNQELEEVRDQLTNERGKIVEQARAEYMLATDHRRRLATAIADQKVLADRLTVDSIDYNILAREVETDRQLHEGLLQKLKETDVAAGVRSANVHVIDRGHVPTLPTSPNVPFDLMIGLTFGLMAGVMVAVGIDFFDRTVKTAEDVERDLRVPYLGAIPAFDKQWKKANGGHLVPLGDNRGPAAKGHRSAAIYWESYRALRTSLLFSSPERRPRSLLVTSAIPGEGKSTTSVNLAIALAQTGARTVLIELDMRRPKIAQQFNITSKQGMSQYLSGQSELHTEIQETGVPNLCLVPAGPVPPNPAELMGSPRMTVALDLLQRHFEYVVIDGPPLLAVTDAAVISSQVSGVILVVGGKTATASVQKARNLLRSVDANILGALINNVKFDAAVHYYATDY